MSRRRSKLQHEEEHENHERWLVSYADFITLLFAFFVVMYAVSRVDNTRLVQVSNALKFALHFEGTGGVDALPVFTGPPSEGGCPVNFGEGKGHTEQMAAIQALRRRIEKKLGRILRQQHDKPTVALVVEGQHLVIRLTAGAFFDAAGVALKPDAMPVLDAIGDELVSLHREVRIEGHTDNRPVSGGKYRNNWELSAARAVSVADYLQQAHGFPPDLLSVAGFGSTRPIVPNDTPEGREANRRIEFVLSATPDGSLPSAPMD